ncbi:Gastrokine-2 [Cricetulus griseus]|uniref:Gastrokine-2 n=1 Tax=Cricetulus griseus TaxID=10029 RepID=G3HIC2_CRIGR|nr:Gastrokine-2 [Cricetulus griseus]
MKTPRIDVVFQVAFLVVLTIFGIQSQAKEVFNIFTPSSNGGSVQETVTIDNQKNTATINIHAGSCSSTTIFDYKHGYIASRVLSRRACYVLKMDHKAIPALDKLQRYLYEKQTMNTMDSGEYTWVKYNPLKSLFTKVDWFLFGSPIEQLCKNMPLYEGEVVTKPSHLLSCDLKTQTAGLSRDLGGNGIDQKEDGTWHGLVKQPYCSDEGSSLF